MQLEKNEIICINIEKEVVKHLYIKKKERKKKREKLFQKCSTG